MLTGVCMNYSSRLSKGSILFFILSFLFACGSDNKGEKPPEVPPSNIEGRAVGPFNESQINVYGFSEGLKGGVVESLSELTSEDGGFNVEFTLFGGDMPYVLLEMTGGSYKDEYTGQIIELNSHHRFKSIARFQEGETIPSNITALTTLASCLAGHYIQNERLPIRQAIEDADEHIAQMLGIDSLKVGDFDDVFRPVNPDADFSKALEHAYIIAGLSGMAGLRAEADGVVPGSKGYSTLDLIGVMCEDLSDGVFDGLSKEKELTFGTATVNSDWYRQYWAEGIFAVIDLDLNGAGFNRGDVLNAANKMVRNTDKLIGGEPSREIYTLATIVGKVQDPGLLECLSQDSKLEYLYQVKRIDCPEFGIQSDNDFSVFKNLTYLDLSGNQLNRFELERAVPIKHLNLNNNPIENLSISQLADLEKLYLNHLPISSIDLEPFQQLTVFSFETENEDIHLRSIDLSNNPLLEELFLSGHDLSSIEVNNHPSLGIVKVACSRCDVISWDESSRIQSIEIDSEVSELNLNQPQLKTLVLNNVTIPNLDLNRHKDLEVLSLTNLYEISEIDLRGLLNLKELFLEGGSLDIFQLGDIDQIESLTFNISYSGDLDIQHLTKLKGTLEITTSSITSILFGSHPDLEVLDISRSFRLNLSLNGDDFPSLRAINGCGCKTLSVQNLPELTEIIFDERVSRSRYLSSLELNNLPKMKTLTGVNTGRFNFSAVGLPSLEVLEFIEGYNLVNSIQDVDIEGMRNLKRLILRSPTVPPEGEDLVLNLADHVDLETISLELFGITELLFGEEHEDLESIHLEGNYLSNINIQNVENLRTLDLSENKITSLDVSQNSLLSDLKLNYLNGFDVSSLADGNNIEQLAISNSELNALPLINLKKLKRLDASNNDLTQETITDFCAPYSLPDLPAAIVTPPYEFIDLSFNNITDASEFVCPDLLAENIVLNGNPIEQ